MIDPVDYVVDVAIADDGPGVELSGPELRHRVNGKRVLTSAWLGRCLGSPQSRYESNDGCDEQHRGKREQQ